MLCERRTNIVCLKEEALDDVFEVGQQFDEGSLTIMTITITITIFSIILKSVILGAVDEEMQERDINLAYVDAIAAGCCCKSQQ
jgi:hypothetical protein